MIQMSNTYQELSTTIREARSALLTQFLIQESGQRRTELLETKQLERALSILIKHTEIIGFSEIPSHDREMSAITLFGKANRNFIGNEFFNALICKLLE